MKRFIVAAVLAGACLSAMPANAARLVSGGTRALALATYGASGQTFKAVGNRLQSFEFEFVTLTSDTNLPLTLTIRSGAGLDGAVVATSTVTAPASNPRTAFWQSFLFQDVTLTDGGIYTALLSTTSPRLALRYSPTIPTNVENPGPFADPYAGGALIATKALEGYCATNACDANFGLTMTTVASAVPEPASWMLMLGGFGMVGAAVRYRRRTIAVA